MLPLLIAVETVRNLEPITVTSAAWFVHPDTPNFNYKDTNDLHRHLIASVCVDNTNLEKAVNIAIRRTLEQAYIRGVIPTTDLDALHLRTILKPYFKTLNLCVPITIVRKHWLITAARTLLKERLAK